MAMQALIPIPDTKVLPHEGRLLNEITLLRSQ